MNNKLKENYKKACNAYACAFCKKHGYDFEESEWIARQPGTIISIADHFVDMQTIIYDIDNEVPEEEFLKWYDYCTRTGMLGIVTPNFSSWNSKWPVRSEKELQEIEDRHRQIEELKEEIKKIIENERENF